MSKVRNSKERIEEQIKKKTQTSELKKLQLGLDTKNTLWTEKKKKKNWYADGKGFKGELAKTESKN